MFNYTPKLRNVQLRGLWKGISRPSLNDAPISSRINQSATPLEKERKERSEQHHRQRPMKTCMWRIHWHSTMIVMMILVVVVMIIMMMRMTIGGGLIARRLFSQNHHASSLLCTCPHSFNWISNIKSFSSAGQSLPADLILGVCFSWHPVHMGGLPFSLGYFWSNDWICLFHSKRQFWGIMPTTY